MVYFLKSWHMTIEDIGLEPVFDTEPIEDEPEPVEKITKKKKAAKDVKKEVKAQPAAEQKEDVPKKALKKKKKKPVKEAEETAEKEVVEDVVKTTNKRKAEPSEEVSSDEPPKKLNRKQTKLLKREMFRKANPDQVEEKPASKPSASKETPVPGQKKVKEYVDYRALDDKYRDILDKMFSTEVEKDARELIYAEIATGRIEKAEFDVVVQRWRQQKRRLTKVTNVNKIVDSEGTLDEVKTMVNDLVKKRKINKDEAGDIVRKWKIREARRLKRVDERSKTQACFHCRMLGHVLADCPSKQLEEGEGICFKCGSTEHQIQGCKIKHIRGFPFATCYICNQQGHISRDCEKNSSGIYPDGGSCNVCGSNKHLKKDCPELEEQKATPTEEKKVIARTMNAMTRADDDFEDNVPKKEVDTKKKKKIVKF